VGTGFPIGSSLSEQLAPEADPTWLNQPLVVSGLADVPYHRHVGATDEMPIRGFEIDERT
jgi:hypothetical protein